jgi:SpoVK/Ycf46/Vps4 family AAA+-type ATPase
MSSLGRRLNPHEPSLSSWSPPAKPADHADGEKPAAVTFQARSPRFSLDQVVLPSATQQQVRALRSLITHHQELYQTWGLGTIDPTGRRVVVNWFGPPGTGKTMLAEAFAKDLGKPIIDVSYAELESKFVGETAKNIVAAFSAARNAGAVLFFDEADSVLGCRMTQVTQAADHGVNVSRAVMLKQLDSFDGVVLFATNLARNFDPAFVRRILRHVEIPLPDADGRLRLWQYLIPEAMPGRAALDWGALAGATDGLSGGDLRSAVVNAASVAIQRQGDARRILLDDLLVEVSRIRTAKQNVGARPPASIGPDDAN